MSTEQLQPWLSPDDTVEVLELLESSEDFLRNTAKYGSLRKDLRKALESQADVLSEFSRRGRRGIVDSGVMLALESIAREKKIHVNDLIVEALEVFISAFNRKRA